MKKRPQAEPAPPETDRQGTSLLPIITWILGVMTAWQVFIFFVHAYQAIAFPYQLDYGEGPILEIALRVAHGEPLYPPINQPPYVIASYEPVYYLLSALGVWIWGPNYWFGRLVSLVSALAIAACVGLIVWRRSGHRFASWLAAGLILAMPHFLVWSALMRIDMLALALSVGAFYLFTRGRWKAGTLLFALGVFTRRTQVSAMVPAFLDYRDQKGWRPAARALVVQVGLVAALMAGGVLVTRGGMFHQLFLHTASSLGKAWSWQQLWSLLWVPGNPSPMKLWPVYFVITAVGAIYCLAARGQRLLFIYFAAACVIFLTGGRIGSAHNYLMEPTAVGAMMFGVMWAELSRRPGWTRPAVMALGGAIALQMLWTDLHLPYTISLAQPRVDPRASQYVIDRIKEAHGPVLCEDVGLTLQAGKEPPLMPFEFAQMARRGVLDPTPVFRKVREGGYALIVLRFDPFDPREIELHRPGEDWKAGRWPDGIIEGMVASYRLDREVGPYFVFVPRR